MIKRDQDTPVSIYPDAGITDLNPYFLKPHYPPKNVVGNPMRELDASGDATFVLSHGWKWAKRLGSRKFSLGSEKDRQKYLQGDVPTMRIPTKDGFLAVMEQTPFVKRLDGVNQLGFRRDQPASNFHSRGVHTRWVVMQSLGTLEAVYQSSPSDVIEKLAADLQQVGILPDDANSADIVRLSAQLLTLAATHHDVATPAGGDTIKGFLKEQQLPHDEEVLLEDMLFPFKKPGFNTAYFKRGAAQLKSALSRYNLGESHLEVAIAMVKGEAPMLLGELIKSEGRDLLEPDRMAYTYRDWLEFGLLAPDMPDFWTGKWFERPISDEDTQLYFRNEIWRIGKDMDEPMIHHVFPELTMEWNKLDPSSSAFLSPEGQVVYSDIDKVLATCLLRIYGHKDIYLGAKMQGHEALFRKDLTQYVETHGLPRSLETATLLSTTDDQMIEGLVNEVIKNNEDRLAKQIWRATRLADFSHFDNELVATDEEYEGHYITRVKRKFKPGFDTLVVDPRNGQITTVGEFCETNDDHFLAWNIMDELDQCQTIDLIVFDT